MSPKIPESYFKVCEIKNAELKKAIHIWKYAQAPEWMKNLCNPDDIDYVAFVPEKMLFEAEMLLREGGPFGCCAVEQIPVLNGYVFGGHHA